MKKSLLICLSSLVLLISACNTNNQQQTSSQSSSNTAAQGTQVPGNAQSEVNPQSTGGGNASSLPTETKLALAIFKLEETPYAISADQANQFLPLWKAVRALSNSDTTAPEETHALWKQIQATFSTEQLLAIEGMNLSFRDMATIADNYTIDLGISGRMGNKFSSVRATAHPSGNNFGGPPGGFEGGGPMMGGGVPGDGQSTNSGARQTAIASGNTGSSIGMGLNSALVEAVIKFLESKAG